MALTARKTTTRTHEGGKLIGVHIGVYQAYYNVNRTLDPTWLG
jgi:hypothetical protein